jgi:hypothetical protein
MRRGRSIERIGPARPALDRVDHSVDTKCRWRLAALGIASNGAFRWEKLDGIGEQGDPGRQSGA